MTRENPLTHHEKLRYDYLLKNIHYLNEKEKREFAFLQDNFFQTLVSTCQPMLIVVVLVAVVVEINWKRRFQKLRSKRKKEVFVLNAYLLG